LHLLRCALRSAEPCLTFPLGPCSVPLRPRRYDRSSHRTSAGQRDSLRVASRRSFGERTESYSQDRVQVQGDNFFAVTSSRTTYPDGTAPPRSCTTRSRRIWRRFREHGWIGKIGVSGKKLVSGRNASGTVSNHLVLVSSTGSNLLFRPLRLIRICAARQS
jgi:hypothetical protein